MRNMIEVSNVSKTFGTQNVLRNVNFYVNAGEIVGLLGPNGSGKTTLIRMLNGVIKPDGGDISINGFDPITQGDEIRKFSGIVTESAGLYHQMSGEENLAFFSELYGVSDKDQVKKLLHLFDLQEHKDKLVGKYSTGMKKRLGLAKALLHQPKLLFLDEPTNGLDPDGIKMVLSYLQKYNEETGTTIVICSHVLHQLETICDTFAFIENKTIVEQGTKAQLEHLYLKEITIKVQTDFTPLGNNAFGYPCEQRAEHFVTFTLPSKDKIPLVLKEILKNYSVYSVDIMNNDLESIYFKVRERAHDK